MLLAIDIGNTNMTLGVCDGQTWQQQWRMLTVQEKTADEYGFVLKGLLRRARAQVRLAAGAEGRLRAAAR